MTAKKTLLKRRAKSAARIPASLAAVTKASVNRRVKSAKAEVSTWSRNKKIGVATAVIAVPVLAAAAIAAAVMNSRKKAALAKPARKTAKSRKA